MPEGPELAYSRDKIRSILLNKRIIVAHPGEFGRYSKLPPTGYSILLEDLQNKGAPTVSEVSTKGKFMWWKLDFPNDTVSTYLWITYGMSGQWMKKSTKHASFIIEHEEGKLYFNDPRHFGTLKFVKGKEELSKKLSTLGPCILSDNPGSEIFAKNILKKSSRTISEALMDQSVVSGVGNYIKSEALYRSRISPWRNVSEITAKEYIDLHESVLLVAKESYQSQGATISTYRNVDGNSGTTQFNFQIYSKKFCPSGHSVSKDQTPDGRSSWWCKICQA